MPDIDDPTADLAPAGVILLAMVSYRVNPEAVARAMIDSSVRRDSDSRHNEVELATHELLDDVDSRSG